MWATQKKEGLYGHIYRNLLTAHQFQQHHLVNISMSLSLWYLIFVLFLIDWTLIQFLDFEASTSSDPVCLRRFENDTYMELLRLQYLAEKLSTDSSLRQVIFSDDRGERWTTLSSQCQKLVDEFAKSIRFEASRVGPIDNPEKENLERNHLYQQRESMSSGSILPDSVLESSSRADIQKRIVARAVIAARFGRPRSALSSWKDLKDACKQAPRTCSVVDFQHACIYMYTSMCFVFCYSN